MSRLGYFARSSFTLGTAKREKEGGREREREREMREGERERKRDSVKGGRERGRRETGDTGDTFVSTGFRVPGSGFRRV